MRTCCKRISVPLILLMLITGRLQLAAQTAPTSKIDLNNLDAFKVAPSGNWQIAGNVTSDRNKNQDLKAVSGKGVLVNLMDARKKDNLQTTWEHADIDLDIDFLMPQGSNSGIYLQGRYEIQLFDSWHIENPKFSDCGGIYQRWDDTKQGAAKGYNGISPRINAAKAPGLWQHLFVSFQAPRFDALGNKTSNARFLKVTLNGATIHENLEVTGPTRAALFNDEKPTGPLYFQGDHGPVAFRNIQYTLFNPTAVQLIDLKYALYKGKFDKMPALSGLKPVKEAETNEINVRLAEVADEYLISFTGSINVPQAGLYTLLCTGSGGIVLTVADSTWKQNHAVDEWTPRGKTFSLKAGINKFSLVNYKSNPKRSPRLGLYLEGPNIRRVSLHGYSSVAEGSARPPIALPTQPDVQINRCFTMHQGRIKPYSIAIGTPDRLNYLYNLNQGNLMQVWNGPYLNMAGMWDDRGGTQLAYPLNSSVVFPDKPSLAVLSSINAAWPDSNVVKVAYTLKGYSLDNAGYPTYRYTWQGLDVEDKITVADQGKKFLRNFNISGASNGPVFCLLAEGKVIEQSGANAYIIDDRNYYLDLEGKDLKPEIRKVDGGEQLVLPVPVKDGKANFSYSYIW